MLALIGVLSGLSAVGSLGNSLSSIGGSLGIKGSKDSGRLESNAQALSQVMQGGAHLPFRSEGVSALQFLLMKSPTSKGGQGGWATSVAQNDAWAKYQQAQQFIASQKTVTQSKPSATGNLLGIGNSGSQTGTAMPLGVGAASGPLGEKTTGYVIVGGIILAMLFLVRK